MIRACTDGYTIEVDTIHGADWCAVVAGFDDANVYQLWQIAGRERRREVSRLLLRRDGRVVAAAEVRLFRVPLTGRGIAYVRWGPLWRRRGEPPAVEVLQRALAALRDEYVVRRRMVLRLVPRLLAGEVADYARIAGEAGFAPLADRAADRTLLLPLGADLAGLRQDLGPKWRGHLNKAERAGLTVTRGTDDALFDDFNRVYAEMLERKAFAPTADLDRHRRLQAVLPEAMKMGVLVARHEGRPCAGVIYSALGDTGVYLFGATNETGMRTSASYLLQWETLNILKTRGVATYDLHGINPEANPGTYSFKKGLAGRRGVEAVFLGPVQAFRQSATNRLLLVLEGLRRRPAVRAQPVGSEA